MIRHAPVRPRLLNRSDCKFREVHHSIFIPNAARRPLRKQILRSAKDDYLPV